MNFHTSDSSQEPPLPGSLPLRGGEGDRTARAETAGAAPHGVLTEFYESPAARASFVQRLFDRSARDYDWVSGVMSFGTDRQYRKRALTLAGLKPGMRLLDVATGTGLVAQAALDLGLAPAEIVGLDPSRGMLAENQRRRPVPLVQGFGESLPFPDAAFDFISIGYALRHVESLSVLFAEFHRVLRPGGGVLILELTRPKSRPAYRAMRFYMRSIIPRVAGLLTRNRDLARLMEYYWATIDGCVPPETILAALRQAEFQSVERRTCGPILSEYVGKRAR